MFRRLRHVVADPLERGEGVAVIPADRRGPGHEPDADGGKPGLGVARPFRSARAVDRAALRQQRTAEPRPFVAQDHPGAGRGSSLRRGQSGRPATDHQHIAMGVGALVAVRVIALGGAAQSRRASNERLVVFGPEAARPHEGLVVKARRQERRQPGIDRHQVVAEARPAVLAVGRKTVIEFGRGGLRIGFAAGAGAQFDQGVGLEAAGGVDAARAVILEAAAYEANAVGDQRGGQRVAAIALELAPIEREADRLRPVDQPALGEPVLLALHRHLHLAAPLPVLASRTANTSWVSVSRSISSQAPQPPPCRQCSVWGPRGLSRR